MEGGESNILTGKLAKRGGGRKTDHFFQTSFISLREKESVGHAINSEENGGKIDLCKIDYTHEEVLLRETFVLRKPWRGYYFIHAKKQDQGLTHEPVLEDDLTNMRGTFN